jgi:2,6-dihydroxypseudooxynicotine hydrolase
MMIEDGNHIATNRAYRWRSQSADWMKERLGEPLHPLMPA